jgi:type IV pilus assembly protein PilE
MLKRKNSLRLRAMTLTELLVVLAILGILILLAYPVVTPIFQRARSKEAQTNLVHLSNLQKAYFIEHAQYAKTLKEAGFEQAKLSSEGGTAHYRVEIVTASNNDFNATATAITDFDGDGTFNIWEIGKEGNPKELVED